jgi:short-subunit dehydrogenase
VASKHAVLGFGKSLRYELVDKGVEVSVVCPGAVATNIFFRDIDYSLHFDLPVPPGTIGIDQAGEEILAGIRTGQQIIPLNDDARGLLRAARPAEPEYLETAMQTVKARAQAERDA